MSAQPVDVLGVLDCAATDNDCPCGHARCSKQAERARAIKARAAVAEMIEALSIAYELALHMPHDGLRVASQAKLCRVLDALVAATGRDPEQVQDEHEARAMLARLGEGK